jgi:ferric-dicitrate binding protein FerR (iron transport regulator)
LRVSLSKFNVACPTNKLSREEQLARIFGPPAEYFLDRRSFFPVVGVGLMVLAPGAARAQPRERAGSVEDIKGEAFAEAASERRRLAHAAPIFIADQVGTGSESRLAMRLGHDTTVRLGELARVTIDRFLVNAGGVITLQSGPMLFDRRSGAAPLPMTIRSPFALIAVRGTRFFAGPSAGVFGVFVERGSVTVSAGGRQVVLGQGQGTNVPSAGSQPTPPAPWKPARISDALSRVQ